MSADPLLAGRVVDVQPDLVVLHVADAGLGVAEVAADLLGLALAPPLELAAQALLDVAVAALATLLT